MTQVTAYAQVEVTIQIYVGTWGADTNLAELSKQVEKEGEQIVNHMVKDHRGLIIKAPKAKFTLIKQGSEIDNT